MADRFEIQVRTVGQRFGCEATVRYYGKEELHTTRLHAFGCDGAARTAAERWVAAEGERAVSRMLARAEVV